MQSSKLRQTAIPRNRGEQGFALIITISLMVLLTLLAVGLLSLSTLSISGSSRGIAAAEARANARLALDLAIAQIQKQTGPDQRITMVADQQSDDQNGAETSAGTGRRHWTGVYRAWTDQSESRPSPEFLSWLVSGQPADLDQPSMADKASSAGDSIELVGPGTLGDHPTEFVQAPIVRVEHPTGSEARIAWWSGDQSTKAALSTPEPNNDRSLADVRTGLQSAPKNAISLAENLMDSKPFASLSSADQRLAFTTGWQQAALLADSVESPRSLFHDLCAHSSGLVTNVRRGGFRKDLSMALERSSSQAPEDPLYEVGGETGINLHELWAYYNSYKELRTRGRASFTTGGRLDRTAEYFQVENNAAACQNDDYFHLKQPVIISYQLALSFETRQVQVGRRTLNRLQLVADPIVTFWNPLDVPVSIPRSAFFSIKYWQFPYDLFISVNGRQPVQCPTVASLSPSDGNYLSLQAGALEQLVFKPGEVIKVSQSGNTIVRGTTETDHKLAGRSGFNYGGGVSLPVRDINLNYINLRDTDTITYEARPNNLTAGQTTNSGQVLPGYARHTRHFSLTHHEVYVGNDRGSDSLGYGGMFIDWDFGNQRVKPNAIRSRTQSGSKQASHRLYANNLPSVFTPIDSSDARPLSVAEMSSRKAPFMLLSYNAKTENGSDLGTKSLSRFNPKAFHVDFYNLSQEERDMLPYEYSVEPLVSWKNRSLEVSPDGSAFFGGAMNAEFGQSFITTHSIPREPIVSLAALQHSFANGFEFQKPIYGYATLNAREPLLPQVSHAIGNSVAPSVIDSSKTESITSGSRILADHSYLANQALWDDWFFSGIAPQTTSAFSERRDQKTVAEDFLNGEGSLPVARFRPNVDEEDIDDVLSRIFRGSRPTDEATELVGMLLRIDSPFNVNSTSVEAWRTVLGTLKDRPVAVRDSTGTMSVAEPEQETPVANLHGPADVEATGEGRVDVSEQEQWIGRRTLSDDEIEKLAEAMVREVRKRGPFLNLADFVNRRVGEPSSGLAQAGAIQSALDSEEAGLNAAYQSGSRSVSQAVAARFPFPEAEEGPISFGAPGIIKQADILTPIAPVRTVRSDSFIVRAYGESVDKSGRVLARAWCEALVERTPEYIDSRDEPDTIPANLKNEVNEKLGRRYQVASFRWLKPEEV